MSQTLTDRVFAALRREHDELHAVVAGLSADQLRSPSGASAWTVAQVLSHLGSGAEIARRDYEVAVADGPPAPPGFNQTVWDRWDALTPEAQARAFVEADTALVDLLGSVAPEMRDEMTVSLAFLPEPIPLGAAVGMRLHEVAHHRNDVEVALDPAATIDADTAAVLLDLLADELEFLLAFVGHPEAVPDATVVDVGETPYDLAFRPRVQLRPSGPEYSARLDAPVEAVVRLIGGRLAPPRAAASVVVSGDIDLDHLRLAFPGF